MRKIINITAGFLLAFTLFSVTACQKTTSDQEVVGVLLRNDSEVFLRAYRKCIEDFAEKNNIKVQIYSANNDAAIQIDQLKTLLLNGVKNFVFIAYNSDLTEQMTKIISSQGGSASFSNVIPTVEALKAGKNFFYASSPETDAGKFQAQIIDGYFKKNPGKLKYKNLRVLYFNGEYGHPAQIYRKVGVLEELAKLGYKVNVLGEFGANWDRASARQYLDLWLEGDNTAFDVIIAQNDEMALGAVDSLLGHNLVDDPSKPTTDTNGDGTALAVPVLGIDATEGGMASLKNNQLYGTVLQDVNAQAATALELVWQCMKNGNAKKFTTQGGLSAAKETTKEEPLTEQSVLEQCFIVPFLPVTK